MPSFGLNGYCTHMYIYPSMQAEHPYIKNKMAYCVPSYMPFQGKQNYGGHEISGF